MAHSPYFYAAGPHINRTSNPSHISCLTTQNSHILEKTFGSLFSSFPSFFLFLFSYFFPSLSLSLSLHLPAPGEWIFMLISKKMGYELVEYTILTASVTCAKSIRKFVGARKESHITKYFFP